MPTPWPQILDFLASARFEDLLIPVATWRDETPPRLRHVSDDVYLKAERGGYLRFTGVGSHGGLQVRLVDEVSFDPDLLDELPADCMAASLWNLFFDDDDRRLLCRAATYFTNNESDLDRGIVRAIELTFGPTGALFLDPWSTTGIKLQTAGGADRFPADHPFDPEHTLRRHTWTNATAGKRTPATIPTTSDEGAAP